MINMAAVHVPIINMEATGRNITRLRKERGITVKDLQDIFGFATPQAIYKWQQGMTLPTVDNLMVLAMVLEVHMEDILVVEGGDDVYPEMIRIIA